VSRYHAQPPNSNESCLRGSRMRWMPRRTMRCLLLPALACAMTLAGSAGRLPAQSEDNADPGREYAIKAAYLYQFGRYVQWPADTFPSPEAPFVIGVLEQDPLLPNLQQIARVKTIQGRPIRIQQFSSPEKAGACHVLFVSSAIAPAIPTKIIRQLSDQHMLLVGDDSTFLESGGMLAFVIEDNNVRVQINRKAAERAGLTISAKLLQVARVVDYK
jgi:hypothetical protein